jgi:uncharacterized protein YdaU (DUF1376 family)
MSESDIGLYIRLLCAQHQHGGLIPSEIFESLTHGRDSVTIKFVKGEFGYYNVRLMAEIELRNKKSSNLSESAKKMWEARKNTIALQSQSNCNTIASKNDTIVMPSEDENEDENVIPRLEDKTEGVQRERSWNTYFHEFLTAGHPSWLNYESQAFEAWKQVPYTDPTATVEDIIASAMAFRASVEAKKTESRYITRPHNFLASGGYKTDWGNIDKKPDDPNDRSSVYKNLKKITVEV